MVNLSRLFGYKISRSRPVSIPVRILPTTTCEQRMPAITFASFRLFPFRSPLLGEYLFGFSSLSYLDGSVLLVRLRRNGLLDITLVGFPHSEISGSKPVCDSPKRIAAYRALHRLSVPSHPSPEVTDLFCRFPLPTLFY